MTALLRQVRPDLWRGWQCGAFLNGRKAIVHPRSVNPPQRRYAMALSRTQQKLVDAADSLGFAASQKSGLRNSLYRLAWVAHAGRFPNAALRHRLVRATRCNPVTSGGSYAGCYYGYTDLSEMDLHNANFTDAQFPFTTLTSTNLAGSIPRMRSSATPT
jgi:uncharacterized protein YjbI with pentapeptide repeats